MLSFMNTYCAYAPAWARLIGRWLMSAVEPSNARHRLFLRRLLWLSLCFFAALTDLCAETQTLVLHPGWNAVYLEVEPFAAVPAAAAGAIPQASNAWGLLLKDYPAIQSVWKWQAQQFSVEFIQDPDTLLPQQSDWLVYYPENRDEHFLSTMFHAQGGQAYLMQVQGTQAVTLQFTGVLVTPKIKWVPKSFNLVGFYISKDAQGDPINFQAFFDPSPAHRNQPIYRLNDQGDWEEVRYPASALMKRGEAYWMYSQGPSDYTGPLTVQLEQGQKLDFGDMLVEQKIILKNQGVNQITLKSDGKIPLYYWVSHGQADSSWKPLTEAQISVDGEEETEVRVSVKRSQMTVTTGASQTIVDPKATAWQSLQDRRYRSSSLLASLNAEDAMLLAQTNSSSSVTQTAVAPSLLTISNAEGMEIEIPVHAEKSGSAGLWIGNVTLNKVSQPVNQSNPLGSTPAEFQFRLIIHTDPAGKAYLLREVIQVWKEGVQTANSQGFYEVSKSGQFVLLTDASQLGSYLNESEQPWGRRISSAAFSFTKPEPIAEKTFPSGTLTVSVCLGHDDRVNPYKHKYHPDHDNLGLRFDTKTAEAFGVKRSITLIFSPTDPEFPENNVAGWGDTVTGGAYQETITGLHKDELKIAGTFRLSRVSNIEYLNETGAVTTAPSCNHYSE